MSSEGALLNIVGKIYGAAADPKQWTATLESLGEVVRASAAALEVRNFTTAGSRIAASVNWQSPSEEYEKYYAPRNILLVRGGRLMTEGSVLADTDACPIDEYLRSEYYNDLLRPNDIGHVLGCTILRRQSIGALLVLARPRRKSPFSKAEREAIHVLMPHLQSALQLHERLIQLQDQRRDLGNALDLLPFGVILVDAKGKIMLLNRAADRILRESDGLSVGPEGLRVASRAQRNALSALIAGAAAAMNNLESHPGGVISVRRPSLRRDYALLVCPMPPTGSGPIISERAAAVIFITDPEAECESPPQLLTRLYGLTPAEARLATVILQGHTLGEAAERAGVTRNTAHSQLMAVFGKTGTRRQSELVKLLLSGPVQLRLDAA